MSEAESDKNIDLIRQISDYPITWDDFHEAYYEGGKPPLGAVYLDNDTDGSFAVWHKSHSWVSLNNSKGFPHFARSIYANKKSRAFVEDLETEVGQQLMNSLNERSSKDHIARMLSAEDCEILTDFSVAWMKYLSENTEARRQEIVKKVPVSTDGSSAMQFWTLAPYIYSSLVSKDIDKNTALRAVLDWSASRDEEKGINLDATYPGIKDLQRFGDGGWFLSDNPDGKSHRLASKIGSHVADQIAPIYKVKGFDR